MSVLRQLGIACVFLALGCNAFDHDPVCDPYACDCAPGCDCPPARATSAGQDTSGTCVGAPLCNRDAECPAPIEDAVAPVCASHGDLVQNGFGGECVLPCGSSEVCGGGRECLGGRCVTVTLRLGNSCVQDADCVAHDPPPRCVFTACDQPGTCSMAAAGGPCRAGVPVCACDGTTFENACAAFPNAVAHEGACDTP